MTNPKHTPAPWAHTPGDDGKGFMSFTGPGGETIVSGCGCCCSPYGVSEDSGSTYYNPTDEDRANARLVVAAPKMLSALRSAVREMQWAGFSNEGSAISALMAVIAEADGEQCL